MKMKVQRLEAIAVPSWCGANPVKILGTPWSSWQLCYYGLKTFSYRDYSTFCILTLLWTKFTFDPWEKYLQFWIIGVGVVTHGAEVIRLDAISHGAELCDLIQHGAEVVPHRLHIDYHAEWGRKARCVTYDAVMCYLSAVGRGADPLGKKSWILP